MKRDKHSRSSKVKSEDKCIKMETFESTSNQTVGVKRKMDNSESDEDTSDSVEGYITIRKRVMPFRATRNKPAIIESIADLTLDKSDSNLVKECVERVTTDGKSETMQSIPKKVSKYKKKYKKKSKETKKKLKKPIQPVATVNKFKLEKMLKSIDGVPELNDSQIELKKCVAHMHPAYQPLWTGRPYFIMKAVNNCLLNRDWDSLTHLLLDLVHLNSKLYKPIIRNVCAIMDKLHPVILENDLQGKFKTIKKYHQLIMDDTTVV